MSVVLWSIVALAAMFGGAWVLRRGGQVATGNAPYFRDMPFEQVYHDSWFMVVISSRRYS